MRSVWGIVAFVCLGLALAGCDPNDRTYFRDGIGTQLYTADTASAAELQNIYLDYLCRQANSYVGPDVPSCAQQAIPANYWPIIVQAGLNDIDARCDSYLAWLDAKRRENAAVLAEIGAVRFAVDALTNPNVTGVSAVGLAAISAAFGLANDTVKNLNSLLLQVDHTTVQSVVLVNRRKFREDLLGLAISNKPIAVHALRSYLTICMPMTISANINSTVTVFEQAGAAAAGRRQPLVSTSTIAEAHSARDRVTPSGTTDPKIDPAHEAIIANFNPKVHSIGFVQGILKKLCAPKSEVLHVTTKTNARIAAYQQSLRDTGDTTTQVTGKLNPRQLGLIQSRKECATQQFENLYEAESFPQGITSVSELMNSKLPKNKQLPTNPSMKDVRNRIAM
ncbi:hypothetical protein XI05_24890 [Bradyrhizobium sp. CCBAU 11357]|nr:hypothetical protein [Bradyrhizobium sp. CCBAU 11357]